MASTKEFKDYIVEQLSILDSITYIPMMGEYIFYYKKVVFGGIYDDRFLVKKTKSNQKYQMSEEIPYPKGKPMYLVDVLEDQEELRRIILDTYNDLKEKK